MYRSSNVVRPLKSDEKHAAEMQKQDFSDMMDALMHSKLTDEEYVQATGDISIKQLTAKGQTLDVQTALALRLVQKGLKEGDVKAIDLSFKYSGFTPSEKKDITIDVTPTYVDDIPDDIKELLAAEALELKAAEMQYEEENDGSEAIGKADSV